MYAIRSYYVSPEQLEIYRESNPDLQSKLEALKDRIRKSGFSVEENYTSPENLGKAILKDLWEVIQKDFPAEDIRITSYNVCYTKLLRPDT